MDHEPHEQRKSDEIEPLCDVVDVSVEIEFASKTIDRETDPAAWIVRGRLNRIVDNGKERTVKFVVRDFKLVVIRIFIIG